MARDFYINGETMVSVKGRADSEIGSIQQLGLSEDPIRVSLNFRHEDINVDAWGGRIPAEVQWFLSDAIITMNLIHIDRNILDVCFLESMGGATAIGSLRRAGARLGNNLPRFAGGGQLGNHYIGLNLSAPVGGVPWRFFTTYLTDSPFEQPLGTEKSIFTLRWRAIPYTQDPWGGVTAGNPGTGAEGAQLWDYVLDT